MIIDKDISDQLKTQVQQAIVDNHCLYIRGGNSKFFYGNPIAIEQEINTTQHSGIIAYEPTELVVTVRSGTRLSELDSFLKQHQQILPFEPPIHNEDSTIGGVVAAGLSGPRRPFSGAIRDHILGIRMINGEGKIVQYGGQVMKNVAGYDLSRLMTGSMGMLGVILDISIKLIPAPEKETTFLIKTNQATACDLFKQWRRSSLNLSATCFVNNQLFVRIASDTHTISFSDKKLSAEKIPSSDNFWEKIRNQSHPFFMRHGKPLWRLAFPPATPALSKLEGDVLVEWGGAQYWLFSNAPANIIRSMTNRHKGNATLYKGEQAGVNHFHPMPSELINLQRRLKNTMDPHGVFSKGRIYKDF